VSGFLTTVALASFGNAEDAPGSVEWAEVVNRTRPSAVSRFPTVALAEVVAAPW